MQVFRMHHEKTGSEILKYSLLLHNPIQQAERNKVIFFFFQVGYKELCTHMANLHNGLERVMAKDKRQGIKDLVRRFAKNGPWTK